MEVPVNQDGSVPGDQPVKKIDGRGRSPGARANQFGPGGKRPTPIVVEEEVPEPDTGAEEVAIFRAMWHVQHRPSSRDKLQIQKQYRKWCRENLNGFMNKYTDLAKREADRKARESSDAGAESAADMKEKAYTTARAFVRRYVADAEGGLIPGFEGHGPEAGREFLRELKEIKEVKD